MISLVSLAMVTVNQHFPALCQIMVDFGGLYFVVYIFQLPLNEGCFRNCYTGSLLLVTTDNGSKVIK